ncbi:MAG: cobalamin-dependent protein [Pseudomonadota bacterium]
MEQNQKQRKIRVLMTKFDLESHDKGYFLVATLLQRAGMEVIMHVFQKTEEVVEVALQEDVDVIGLSASSGDTHLLFLPEIVDQLKRKDMQRVLVIGGGRIFGKDAQLLMDKGVSGVFGPGTQGYEIVDFIKERIALP